MPREVRDSEQFRKILPTGHELRVVRGKDQVKLKLRTPGYLYTFKTGVDEAEDILKSAKEIEIIEISEKKGKEEKSEAKEASKPKEATS